jgi:hypothetical protein
MGRISVKLGGRLSELENGAFTHIDLAKGMDLFSKSEQVDFLPQLRLLRNPVYRIAVIGPVNRQGHARSVAAKVTSNASPDRAIVVQKWRFEFAPEAKVLWRVPFLDFTFVNFELIPTKEARNRHGAEGTDFWSREILRAQGIVEQEVELKESIGLRPASRLVQDDQRIVAYLSDLMNDAEEYMAAVEALTVASRQHAPPEPQENTEEVSSPNATAS